MEEADARAAAIEAFWRACGVTVRLAEVPQDRFADSELIPAVRSAPPRLSAGDPGGALASPRSSHAVPGGPRDGILEADGASDAVSAAREVARTAASLEALHHALRAFDGCPLKATARGTCVGEGPVGAPLMVVGEAPGKDEDEAGRPFVGRSGKLLEKMLAAIGLSRADVFITNVIPWRPPGNRTPSPIETATCEVFVRREIALVRPRVLLLLGGAAAKTLLKVDAGIVSQRGNWQAFALDDGGPVDAVATFHPAYLLRTPAEKRRAWQDLLSVRRRLDAER